MARRTSRLLQDERGATAIEYGLIISLVVIAILTALSQLAGTTITMWSDVEQKVSQSSS